MAGRWGLRASDALKGSRAPEEGQVGTQRCRIKQERSVVCGCRMSKDVASGAHLSQTLHGPHLGWKTIFVYLGLK